MKYVTTYNDHRSVELAVVDFRSPKQRDPYEPKPDYSRAYEALRNIANYHGQAAISNPAGLSPFARQYV